MPPRWVCLGIGAFWLAANGWLVGNDRWPQREPGQPPAFEIDLVQEVQTARPAVLWTVWQCKGNDRRKVFKAETRIRHPERGVYVLEAELISPIGFERARVLGMVEVTRMKSSYRVDEKGQLLGLVVDVEGKVQGVHAGIHLRGDVQQERFAPELRANLGVKESNARLP